MIDYIRIEVISEDMGIQGVSLRVRTKYRGQEYGAQIPLKEEFLESDFDQYMDASLRHLKEVLRRALRGETVG